MNLLFMLLLVKLRLINVFRYWKLVAYCKVIHPHFHSTKPCGEHFTFHRILFIRGYTLKPLPLRKKRKNSLILYFTIIYRPFSIFKELPNRHVFMWLYVLTRNSQFSSLMTSAKFKHNRKLHILFNSKLHILFNRKLKLQLSLSLSLRHNRK